MTTTTTDQALDPMTLMPTANRPAHLVDNYTPADSPVMPSHTLSYDAAMDMLLDANVQMHAMLRNARRWFAECHRYSTEVDALNLDPELSFRDRSIAAADAGVREPKGRPMSERTKGRLYDTAYRIRSLMATVGAEDIPGRAASLTGCLNILTAAQKVTGQTLKPFC